MNRNLCSLKEGIEYDKESNSFIFDFENDSENSLMKLKNDGLKESTIFNNTFYYQYYFENSMDSQLRKDFIEYLKFPKKQDDRDVEKFVEKAVDSLHRSINLYDFDTIVFPESRSELNRKISSYLYQYNQPEFSTFEIAKNLPSDIEFDFEKFEEDVLNSTFIDRNGKEIPRYNRRQKEEEIKKIEKIMDEIHNKDYFSIAKDFKSKTKYRKYIKNFYHFKDKKEETAFKRLSKPKILLIDDIMTSGTTLSFVIKSIKTINPEVEIVVFALIGKN